MQAKRRFNHRKKVVIISTLHCSDRTLRTILYNCRQPMCDKHVHLLVSMNISCILESRSSGQMAVRVFQVHDMKLVLAVILVVQCIVFSWIYLPLLGSHPLSIPSLDDGDSAAALHDNHFDHQSLVDISSPRIAHTVLTNNFSMPHYLTVKSIMRHVQPAILYIHIGELSASIPEQYRTDLFRQYKNIEIVEYIFRNNSLSAIDAIQGQVREGIYFTFGLLLQPSIDTLLSNNTCLQDCKWRIVTVDPQCAYNNRSNMPGTLMKCFVSDDPSNDTAPALAIPKRLYGKIATYFYTPSMDIEEGELGPWHKRLWQAYCGCDQFEPKRHPRPVVPSIAHYIWFAESKWNMTFMQLVSVLSNLKINKVKRIIIHSNIPPTGPHWEWLQRRYAHRVARLFHPQPMFIYGKKLNPDWPQHRSDVARLMILQRFGGMYFDFDVVVVRSQDELRYYDGVMGLDISVVGLANGLIMFSSSSEFLKIYSNNYVNYIADNWGLTSVLAPMQLYLKRPSLLKVPRRFLDMRVDETATQMYTEATEYDTTDFYAFHPCYPKPEDYFNFELNFETTASMNCTLGSLLRYVINQPD